nr:MAG TPA: hypothetical protein [Caudoviricetes sp.]
MFAFARKIDTPALRSMYSAIPLRLQCRFRLLAGEKHSLADFVIWIKAALFWIAKIKPVLRNCANGFLPDIPAVCLRVENRFVLNKHIYGCINFVRPHHHTPRFVGLGQIYQPSKIVASAQLAELLCGFVIHVDFLRRQPRLFVGGKAVCRFTASTMIRPTPVFFVPIGQSLHHISSILILAHGLPSHGDSSHFLISYQSAGIVETPERSFTMISIRKSHSTPARSLSVMLRIRSAMVTGHVRYGHFSIAAHFSTS